VVEVSVWSPQNLSKEESALMDKLKSSPNFQPGSTSADEEEEKGFFGKIKDAFT